MQIKTIRRHCFTLPQRTQASLLLITLAVLWVIGQPFAFAGKPMTVITGAAVLLPDGTVEDNWAVSVGPDGTISALLPAESFDDDVEEWITYQAPAGSVLTPGLHDLMGALGTRGKPGSLRAGKLLIDPELDAGHSFDSSDPWLDEAAKHGVLYTTLAAQPLGVVNGKSATFLCQTSGAAKRLSDGKTMLALGDSVLSNDRMPTSRTSLLSIWREWIASQPSILNSPGILYVAEGMDLRQALGLTWSKAAIPVFIHTGGDARSPLELLGRLGKQSGPVHMVVGPFLEGGDRAHLMMAVSASRQGVELSFAGGLPAGPTDHLRGSAALAVAAGMDSTAARRALFSNPAHVSGASDTGVIAAGNRADMVLFSGDPLDPASEVIHVWRGGQGMRVALPGEVEEMETIRR